jgi:hypothetical protein
MSKNMPLSDLERTIIRWERLKARAVKNDLVLKVDESREPPRMVIQNDGVTILVSGSFDEIEGYLKAADEFAPCRG